MDPVLFFCDAMTSTAPSSPAQATSASGVATASQSASQSAAPTVTPTVVPAARETAAATAATANATSTASRDRFERADWVSAYRNVSVELDDLPLTVARGEISAALRGTLYRNGPGRLERGGVWFHHPFDGDGMIAAIRFADGRALETPCQPAERPCQD